MQGTRPRAPCPLTQHSIQQAAPTPSPCVYILEDEEWIFGVYLGGKWKQEIFFTCLFWVTMTLSCKMFREFYRRYFCPVLDQPYKQTWIGSSPPSMSEGFTQAFCIGAHPLPRLPHSRALCTGSRQLGEGGHPPRTVTIRNKAPGLLYLQCQWAIYTWPMLPIYGHHWRKKHWE